MKKSVLILTMYYPPLNLVPVNRIRMMVEAFSQLEWHVTVITRSYDEIDHNSTDLEVAKRPSYKSHIDEIENLRIVRLPYSDSNPKLKLSSKLPPLLRGYFNMKQVDVYHYDFYIKLEQFLRNDGIHYSLAISSYGPSIMLKCTWLLNDYSEKIIQDYRDSFITEGDSSYLLKMKQSIIKKLNKRISGAVYASQGILDIMERNSAPSKSAVIMNGVQIDNSDIGKDEHEILSILESIKEDGKTLFLHAGSIYRGQNIRYLINCIKLIPNTQVVCLGNQKAEEGTINLTKVSLAASRKAMEIADALLLPVWEGRYTGFSGKLLEYLSCNKPVVCGPQPQDDLTYLLSKSPNTLILDGEMEADMQNIISFVNSDIAVNDDLINQLSANYQGKKLVKFAESL